MAQCSFDTNCRFPHVGIETVSVSQATASLHNCKPSMASKVTAEITARGAEFKA